MVRKISFTAGIFFLSCRPASSPFKCGIAISRTTTSGRSRSAAFKRERPSSTKPTTEYLGSRRPFSASSNIIWSSASSMRGRVTVLSLRSLHSYLCLNRRDTQWNLGKNFCALSGRRPHRDRSSNKSEALPHSHQSDTRVCVSKGRVKAEACIRYSQADLVGSASDLNISTIRAAVLDHVPQGLLSNPEKAQRDILWNVRQGPALGEIHRNLVLRANFLTKTHQGRR